jgi:hypothetical protein
MQPTLPTESFIAAALAELARDTLNLLEAAQQQKPLDKEEIGFWRRQYNGFNKAEYQWHQGVRPLPTEDGWLIPSASQPGSQVHRAIRHGGVWVCSCRAGELNQFHWHTALLAAIERGGELESLAEDAAELRISQSIAAARGRLLHELDAAYAA